MAERDDLSEQIDACNQKKAYIQDQITEVQGQIVALDENKVGLLKGTMGKMYRKSTRYETQQRLRVHRKGRGLD